MNTLPLGQALDQISTTIGLGAGNATIIDTQLVEQHPLSAATETYDMGYYVYVRDEWIERGKQSGVFLLMRLGDNPLVVLTAAPERTVLRNEGLPLTATTLERNGHTFEPLDMFWICVCGERLEADAHDCPECGSVNPFLGLLI